METDDQLSPIDRTARSRTRAGPSFSRACRRPRHNYDDPLMMPGVARPVPRCSKPRRSSHRLRRLARAVLPDERWRPARSRATPAAGSHPQNRYGQAASAIRYRMQRITPFEISAPRPERDLSRCSQFSIAPPDGGQTRQHHLSRPPASRGYTRESLRAHHPRHHR